MNFGSVVDDDAIDATIRKKDSRLINVQIKASSKNVAFGSASLFATIPHKKRNDYWFIFYSERMDMMWLMTSAEFIQESSSNKNGKHKGKRTIHFNGRNTKKNSEHCKSQFEKYIVTNFDKLR